MMKGNTIHPSYFLALTLLAFAQTGTAAPEPLTAEVLTQAKEVQVSFFDTETGLPALRLGYSELKRAKPRIGPLTLNYPVLQVKKLRLHLDLDQPGCGLLNNSLARFLDRKAARFIQSDTIEIRATRNGSTVLHIHAGHARILPDGTVRLNDGVGWEVPDGKGRLRSACLKKPPNWNGWVLYTDRFEPVAELSLQH